jgi:ferredoxin
MPEVRVQGKIIICQEGENLRQFCLKNGIEIHNGQSRRINCRGIGTCGTCALKIEGEVSEANWKDRARR